MKSTSATLPLWNAYTPSVLVRSTVDFLLFRRDERKPLSQNSPVVHPYQEDSESSICPAARIISILTHSPAQQAQPPYRTRVGHPEVRHASDKS